MSYSFTTSQSNGMMSSVQPKFKDCAYNYDKSPETLRECPDQAHWQLGSQPWTWATSREISGLVPEAKYDGDNNKTCFPRWPYLRSTTLHTWSNQWAQRHWRTVTIKYYRRCAAPDPDHDRSSTIQRPQSRKHAPRHRPLQHALHDTSRKPSQSHHRPSWKLRMIYLRNNRNMGTRRFISFK